MPLRQQRRQSHQVAVSTFERWQRNYDHNYQTLSWWRFDTDKVDRNLVALLWCSACRDYQDKICSMKNYSSAWITGTENQRTSNVLDHVACDQHIAAMSHLCTAHSTQLLRMDLVSVLLIIIMSKSGVRPCPTIRPFLEVV